MQVLREAMKQAFGKIKFTPTDHEGQTVFFKGVEIPYREFLDQYA